MSIPIDWTKLTTVEGLPYTFVSVFDFVTLVYQYRSAMKAVNGVMLDLLFLIFGKGDDVGVR